MSINLLCDPKEMAEAVVPAISTVGLPSKFNKRNKLAQINHKRTEISTDS
jgi:hypothetical protein